MTVYPIDTLKVAERLIDAGVPEQQAKAHASVLVDSLNSQETHLTTNFCTKDDLKAALAPIESRLSALELKIDQLAAKLKSELLTWIVALGLLQGSLITSVLLILIPAVL